MYDLGVTYFDCARSYWGGKAEEAYGIGLDGVRQDVFLTTKTHARTAEEAEQELATSLRLLRTDYLDLWQAHSLETQADIDALLAPGGAIEALEAATRASPGSEEHGGLCSVVINWTRRPSGENRACGVTPSDGPLADATLAR